MLSKDKKAIYDIVGDTTYSMTIKLMKHKDHEAFQNSEEFKEIAKSRYKIEA